MSLYKRYETSTKLSTKGAPVKFEKNEDGSVPTFFIARAHTSNQLFAKAVADHYPDGADNLGEEEMKDKNLAVFLDGNLIGWENVLDREGTPMEFTRANAEQLLRDLPELLTVLHFNAHNLSNFLKAAEEKAVKN